MSNFREQVIALVRSVPSGRIVSYGQVARVLGSPRASRVVGGFLASLDSTDSITPWHRVVNRHGGVSHRADPFRQTDPVTEQFERLQAEGLECRSDGKFDLNIYGLTDEALRALFKP